MEENRELQPHLWSLHFDWVCDLISTMMGQSVQIWLRVLLTLYFSVLSHPSAGETWKTSSTSVSMPSSAAFLKSLKDITGGFWVCVWKQLDFKNLTNYFLSFKIQMLICLQGCLLVCWELSHLLHFTCWWPCLEAYKYFQKLFPLPSPASAELTAEL